MTTDPADPTALPAGNPVGTSLPADILQQSCRRVTLAAGLFAGLWALVLVFTDLLAHASPGALGLEAWPMPGTLVAGIGVLRSVVLATTCHRFHLRMGPNGSSLSAWSSRS